MVQKKKEYKKRDRNESEDGLLSLAIVNHQLVLSFAASNTRKQRWSYIQFPTSMRQKTDLSFKKCTDRSAYWISRLSFFSNLSVDFFPCFWMELWAAPTAFPNTVRLCCKTCCLIFQASVSPLWLNSKLPSFIRFKTFPVPQHGPVSGGKTRCGWIPHYSSFFYSFSSALLLWLLQVGLAREGE